ncbi:hypothetical protein [Aureimonas jatrophae]|uniref:Metal binding domain of Ada n=1 Tax=Aureimonas jatrophae TaxID=1166073 RepID=A0A1H0HWV3_9HYPH|nr:hypothetical protein [Aureimonas jatrophae]MBB3950819.1 hypothetical protein [Aureimonas jatrophae]SDO23659.1 hypothetical protein SAMN05192530_104326 [Aureimonas jatrophae]
MPRQNRVTPFGALIATPDRGTLMGNRGILHDAAGHLGTRRWAHPHWVACRLDFGSRRRPIMAPGRYTELFFLDEATSLAAGHRPCAECRREDFGRFRAAWALAHPAEPASAPLIDRRLHAERVRRDRTQVTFEHPARTLPVGTMVQLGGAAWLVSGDTLRRWHGGGYGEARARPDGSVTVLTPRPTVAALEAGYAVALHSSVAATGA